MTTWSITDSTPQDAAPLAAIMGNWVRETGWMPVLHSAAEDKDFVAGLIRNGTVRVARESGRCLGFLAREGSWIVGLYLAPEARGQGLGKALIDEVKAAEPEVGLWVFQANSGAVAFYRREGFVETERTDGQGNDERLPDICMMWRRPV